jgi:DNA-binding transcriptional ArsR family regulator
LPDGASTCPGGASTIILAVTNIEAALGALAEPTRLVLVDALRDGPLTVGDLARRVPVTRSAVSQHLKVLKEAGVVRDDARGTRRLYRLQAGALGEVRAYLDALWRAARRAVARDAAHQAHRRVEA